MHIGKQCELRDGENLTTDVLNRAVHFALLIFEYPQIEDLVSRPRNLLVTILIGHTHQNHESRTNLLGLKCRVQCAQLIDHVHGCFRYSLHYNSHDSLQQQQKSAVPLRKRRLSWWSRGESNPGPMTEPTVFYVRSLLAKLAVFLPPSLSQTTDGEHIRSKSPDGALRLNSISKSS